MFGTFSKHLFQQNPDLRWACWPSSLHPVVGRFRAEHFQTRDATSPFEREEKEKPFRPGGGIYVPSYTHGENAGTLGMGAP